MSQEKKSSAFLRTDQAIIDAMIAILNHKSFEKITVQDILEEAGISRGTFYAHYPDKYAVVEKMQDIYKELLEVVLEQFSQTTKDHYPMLSQQMMSSGLPLFDALLKVHTDRVDIKNLMQKKYEKEYLKNATGSSTSEEEAKVYAAAMMALQMTYYDNVYTNKITYDYVDRVTISALLHILHLDNDKETIDFLQKKLDDMEKHRFAKQ